MNMIPKFDRFSAAAHFVEGLEEWAEGEDASVYPEIIPAGAERYPLITIETGTVSRYNTTKDGGIEPLTYEVTVTVAVKEGVEERNRMANDVVDIMDGTAGEHDGYRVTRCEWTGGTPGYDPERDCYYIDTMWTLEVMPPN